MAYQPYQSKSESAPYPPNQNIANAPYPPSSEPPPYPSYPTNPSYPSNPNYPTNPGYPTPSYPSYPAPLNAAPPLATVQYNAYPQPPPANIAALNSVPTTTYWGGNYGPGWYRYSSATRKKIMIISGVFAGLLMTVFIIVFVTMTVKAQRDHEEFRKKHFGD